MFAKYVTRLLHQERNLIGLKNETKSHALMLSFFTIKSMLLFFKTKYVASIFRLCFGDTCEIASMSSAGILVNNKDY